MKIVADTSTFIAVGLEEPEKADLVALTMGHQLLAPEVLPFEIGNALTAMLKKHTLEADQVVSAWDAIQAIAVELRSVDLRSALLLATRLGIYAYDSYILECAIASRCPLLTLDRRLRAVAQEAGVPVLE